MHVPKGPGGTYPTNAKKPGHASLWHEYGNTACSGALTLKPPGDSLSCPRGALTLWGGLQDDGTRKGPSTPWTRQNLGVLLQPACRQQGQDDEPTMESSEAQRLVSMQSPCQTAFPTSVKGDRCTVDTPSHGPPQEATRD